MENEIRGTITETIRQRAALSLDGKARLAPFKTTIDRALGVHDAVRAQHANAAKNEKLTPLGRQDELRRHIADGPAKELYRSRKAVELLSTKLTELRANLRPPVPEKSDLASAAIRAESRAMLRGMSPGQRANLLLTADADLMLRQAALEGPPVLSGINEDFRQKIIEAYAEKHRPGDLQAVTEAEAALDLANVAVSVATNTTRAVGEFPSDALFSTFITSAVGAEKAKAIAIGVNQEFGNALTQT